MNPKRTDKSNRDVSEFPELWADDDLVSVWDVVAVLDNMRSNGHGSGKHALYIVHKDATVDGMGSISYPIGFAPKQIQ